MVVLKRLSDALSAGDRVLALIRGSAVNHDGPSSGLTVPNGLAQQALLRRALASAGVAPGAVGYVEAHGTGTSLGDPIEAEALGAVFAEGRSQQRPLLIGSVKSNIGHLESAAGVAGLIKLVLSLGRGQLPGQLHFEAPSPHIRWERLKLQVVQGLQSWEPIEGRRIGGVSSFGFSGTNAHVLVEGPPPALAPGAGQPERPLEILPLSGRTEAALRDLAGRYRERLGQAGAAQDWRQVCHTAAVGRAGFVQRLSVRGADAAALQAGLAAFVAGQPHAALVQGQGRAGARPRVGFLFTGQGSQYAGMGAGLYAHCPRLRQLMDRAEAVLAGRLPQSLGALIRGEHPQAEQLLNQTLYTQPALYVLEYALAELWRGFGVEPVAVLGHSLGEYVGCAVAGVFGFEEGLQLVAERARLMHELPAAGAMLVVAASEADMAGLLAGREQQVSLAGVNAARQVTVSGERLAVQEIAAQCAARGWRTHALPVSQGFHSPLMEPIGAALQARAEQLTYAAPHLAVISNLTGEPLAQVSGAYWRQHMREPVRFLQGLAALRTLGCDVLLEVGPRPVLIQLARQAAAAEAPAEAGECRYLTSLKGPGSDEWEALGQAMQELHAAGAQLDWAGWNRDYPRRKVDVPTYPFERRRHWLAASAARVQPGEAGAAATPGLLGRRVRSALAAAQFDVDLSATGANAWLADHRIGGQAILPATGFMEIMLAAGQQVQPHWRSVQELSLLAPLSLPQDGSRALQTVVDEVQESGARVQVFAAEAGTPADAPERFRLLAEARVGPLRAAAQMRPDSLARVRGRCAQVQEAAAHYQGLAGRAAQFGPAFRGLQRLWSAQDEALAQVRVELAPLVPQRPHPALLDACLQSAAALLPGTDTFLPVRLQRFECQATHWPESLYVHVRRRSPQTPTLLDFTLLDEHEQCLARLDGLLFQKVAQTQSTTSDSTNAWLHEIRWQPCVPTSDEPAKNDGLRGRWLLLPDSRGVAQALAMDIADAGGTCIFVGIAATFGIRDRDRVELDPADPQQLRELIEFAGEDLRGIVDCRPIDADSSLDGPPEQTLAHHGAAYGSALRLIQASLAQPATAPLFFICAGAAPVEGEPGKPIYGTISALRATLRAEFPDAICRLIDLDGGVAPDAAAAALARELEHADEPEVALRRQTKLAPRLVPLRTDGVAAADGELVELVASPSGLIEDLGFRTRSRVTPQPDEVEIEVGATGLNFRDVLNALAMLSGTPRLGGECAGVVVRAGSASGFNAGDEVLAFCPGQSGSFVTVPSRDVIRKPAHLNFAQAAALPIAYLTALYGLQRLGSLQPGETILIHAAAGGLGQAAVHVALAAGAKVYATAGSEAKREYVRAMGAVAVMSSRTVAFVDEIMHATGGRGVDVVLNTLNGDFVPASFQVLAKGGRFLEVGKRGVFTPAEAQGHRPDAAYFKFDLGDAAESDGTLIPSLLRELILLLDSRRLPPLPVETYSYAHADLALRKMAEARHIGKLVLSHDHTGGSLDIRGGAFLITGGFGALGMRAAAWLAERGAATVILVGPRRRRPEAIAAIEAAGTRVVAIEADCADVDALRRIIAVPPAQQLRGVIHCAGSLADDLLPRQSVASFERVAAPKLAGALALHQATADLDLRYFVLFSSAAAFVGLPGQANYAAANAALGIIARARRFRGQAAVCVDWGPWQEGMAAQDRARRRDFGMPPMSAQMAFDALEKLLVTGVCQAAVLPVKSWAEFFAAHPSAQIDPLFSAMRPAAARTPAQEADVAGRLHAASAQARRGLLLDHLREQLAKVLGADPRTPVDPSMPFHERGLDSLMSVEVRNLLVKSLGLRLPSTVVLDYSTPDALCDYLLSRLFVTQSGGNAAADDAAMVAALSEVDAEAMLMLELERVDA